MFEKIREYSEEYGLTINELHMLNIQRLGLSQSELDAEVIKTRALFRCQDELFHKPIINNSGSSYRVEGKQIYYDDQLIPISIENLEEDTVKPYYFRGDKVLVVNSTIFGACGQKCIFCEQNNAPEGKRRYSLVMNETDLFNLVAADKKLISLESLSQITFVASCAGSAGKALELIKRYKDEAIKRGFKGKMLFASNEIRSQEGVSQFAQLENMILAFTVECFQNRTTIMPGKKGEITLPEIKDILKSARDAGAESTYFYIFSIDDLENTKKGFEYLKDAITIAPTGPNYQPQGKDRKLETKSLEHLLEARKVYLDIHRGMERFESCQNYRSLWPLENNPNRSII